MKPYNEDSFVDPGSLPALEPILKSWLDVQRKYEAAMNNEEPAWCYLERTCIGFLSAAAWMSGGVTLEEWGIEKNWPDAESSHGRCDLYIFHNNNQFFIEAKHAYSNPTGDNERELDHIRARLNAAVRDASVLAWSERSEQLGVLFVVPVYRPGSHPGNFDDDITAWLQRVATVPHSAMAWLFQPRKNIQGPNTEYVSPGILLLARTPD